MEVLVSHGWKMFYECLTCKRNGPVKHWSNDKYPTYEIRTMERKQAFLITNRNMQIYGPDWLYKIEDALKHFNIDA
jgi:hypothetical protein